MALTKTEKKCIHAANKAAKRFGPAVGAQVAAKCLRKAGVSFGGVRRKKRRSRRSRR